MLNPPTRPTRARRKPRSPLRRILFLGLLLSLLLGVLTFFGLVVAPPAALSPPAGRADDHQSHPGPFGDLDPHRDSEPIAGSFRHAQPDCNPDPDGFSAGGLPHPDADPHAHPDSHPHAHSHPDPHTLAGPAQRHAFPNPDLRPQRQPTGAHRYPALPLGYPRRRLLSRR